MALPQLTHPITYLITSGTSKKREGKDFAKLLALIECACDARVDLIQIREKKLSARSLYELTLRAASITRQTKTLLLVNDRADIARAGGADGVHLTTGSIEARAVRRTFGHDFLIGVSTHSLSEAQRARDQGADFATFGPIFDAPSKRIYGAPVGLAKLSEAAHALAPFPLIALGGITTGENAHDALRAGAKGIAAIRLFSQARSLSETISALKRIKS